MLSQHLGSFVLAVGVVGGVFAHIHLTGLAGKPHADLINGEIAGGVADGAQDAAPVGIAAEHCGLEQVGAHHAAADGTGGLQVGGVGHFAGDEVGGTLAVTGVLGTHVLCNGGERGMKKRRQWTTYSGSGKRVAPRTRTSRVSRGKEMGVPRLWVQLIVCGALFVALIGLKLLMPGNLSALRGTLGQWLVRDADFISAFSAVGRAASGEQDWGDSLSEAYVAVFGGESKAQEVSGNLIGMTVSEQDVSDLTSARELPALAVGEQRILGFSYTTPLSGTVTSPFGWRDDPNGAGECFHYGMDIAGEEGAPVACFADGTVGTVGESNILGNYVTVNHEGGFSTLYAHCSAITASAGQSVKKGDAIAKVGSTGNATGSHLHFEVHDGEEYLNPVYYAVP